MSYGIHRGRPRKIPENYFEEHEIEELRNKYKGKLPPITESARVGTRRAFGVDKIVHREGHIIDYNGKLAVVKKVEKRGMWIETFKSGRDNIAVPSGKPIFISESKVERKISPVFYPNLSIGSIAPYNMATVDV